MTPKSPDLTIWRQGLKTHRLCAGGAGSITHDMTDATGEERREEATTETGEEARSKDTASERFGPKRLT